MERMAGDAYNDLAGRPSTKRLVEATTIKEWTSHVTSGNLSRLTPLTGVKHSAGHKRTENHRPNTCLFCLSSSNRQLIPTLPFQGVSWSSWDRESCRSRSTVLTRCRQPRRARPPRRTRRLATTTRSTTRPHRIPKVNAVRLFAPHRWLRSLQCQTPRTM
jgi:hypothetical protein